MICPFKACVGRRLRPDAEELLSLVTAFLASIAWHSQRVDLTCIPTE